MEGGGKQELKEREAQVSDPPVSPHWNAGQASSYIFSLESPCGTAKLAEKSQGGNKPEVLYLLQFTVKK